MVSAAPASVLTGPFKTKRYNNTLTLNLGSHEVALAVSRTNPMPRASVIVTTAAREIMRLSKNGDKVHGIVLFGSEYDPTTHPNFLEITENVRDLRNKWFPKAKFILFTDKPDLAEYRARHAMGIYDQPTVRIEWGTAKLFSAMTGRKGPELATLVEHLHGMEKLVVRATFQRGKHDNSTDSEFKGWLKKLEEIRPAAVQISNLFNVDDGQKTITPTRMKQIVEALAEDTDYAVTVLEDRDSPLE